MSKKLDYELKKTEKGLSFKINYMDERFRYIKNEKTVYNIFKSKNNVEVVSCIAPFLAILNELYFIQIHLRGYDKYYDDSKSVIKFENDSDRDIVYGKIIEALSDFEENCEYFK